ncbi:penicillin-binding protein 2 [Oceanicola granulosus HTCC2516]|uniref:Penicillin-binding protein 2 n=1 Tax=Oceanicola granulosus (strain ATCC BAA-861 / DSM 15982 / KCTC 12143 / HTCC2516) TaxID=314256 RepID=Q2CGZ9_OCEGH|nr:penicillin-binding protein 2 [Oceanicola granulosus]EAR52012.1 penicillin-binding protein 2 [Oceanicola granulosus HTCC2516]
MKRPTKDLARSARVVTRRGLVLAGAQLGVMGLLGWRMHAMQVEQADEFRLLAEENRVNLRLLPPARGLIVDRDGRKLAENEQNYRIVIVREDAGDVDETLRRLQRLIAVEPEAIERAKEEMMRVSPFVPVTIVERVPWEDVARVTVNAPSLHGIVAEVGLSRFYNRTEETAHVVGYVGPVSDYDLTRGYLASDDDPLLKIPRFQVGKTGVEARLEHVLRGSAGTKRIEVNAVGRVMRELGRQEGIKGKDVQLTIDLELQAYMNQRLDTESASAVLIDLEDGDIRAIGSTPSFDPNLFVRGISVADWTRLNEDKYRPLASKAVQDAYPPGSTFKMVTALAALEGGEVDSEETVYCPGHMEVSGLRFHCWRRGGHGNINLHESLKQSCDVYYYDVGQRIGIDKIAEMARRLGLGQRHDIPMSAVTEGIAPDKAWKRGFNGEEWRIGDTVNASIGQGYVLTSPLQLAVMVARIATGRSLTPRLVRSIDGVPEPSGRGEALGLNENNLRKVRDSMSSVVNHPRGTAHRVRIVAEEFQMAGKTGTSQVRRITAEERAAGVTSNADLPWERRDHGLFVAFAPLDKPRYAVAVVVEHGGGGSAASPLARDILLQALYGGTPPLEAYPSSEQDRIREQQELYERRAAERNDGRDRA